MAASSKTPEPGVFITPAKFPHDKEIVARLFSAYAEAIQVDLAFQSFTDELAGLPGKYAAEEGGACFLAYKTSTSATSNTNITSTTSPRDDTNSDTSDAKELPENCIGCVALRTLPTQDPTACEMKRLYITPEARGLGVGKLLIEAVVDRAKEMGYKSMYLDTLSHLMAARTLYVRHGFEESEKYNGHYVNPLEGVVFYRKLL